MLVNISLAMSLKVTICLFLVVLLSIMLNQNVKKKVIFHNYFVLLMQADHCALPPPKNKKIKNIKLIFHNTLKEFYLQKQGACFFQIHDLVSSISLEIL